MKLSDVLTELDEQISRLQQARDLLLPLTVEARPGSGRPKQTPSQPTQTVDPKQSLKRKLTEERKQRIREAQKARWAARKAEPKATTEEVTATEPTADALVEV